MANGYSLHIGLNHVDPAAYKGWDGKLSGCLNDAGAMKAICDTQGFATTCLLDEQATSSAVIGAIKHLATQTASGDTVVISYSGHGGQVPDTTGTEDDGLCETWVCFDRMVVDKELYALWSDFPRDVHIEVYSDSCHSGTVVRELIQPAAMAPAMPAQPAQPAPAKNGGGAKAVAKPAKSSPRAKAGPPNGSDGGYRVARGVPRAQAAYNAVFAPAVRFNVDRAPKSAHERMIPAPLAFQLFSEQPALQRQARPGPIQCGVALISGCQDNQTSSDGTVNGLFTEKLLKVWDNGAFQGTIPQLHHAIVALMPDDQTPNYLLVGIDDDQITNGRPLTVLDGTVASADAPVITPAQASVPRTGAAPSFDLRFGTGRNGVVELATDTACFANSTGRTADNFYATWSDSPRLRDGSWTVPDAAWGRLKAADAIYYRAGSTTSSTGWDDYLVSSAADGAPSIAVTGGDGTGTGAATGDGTGTGSHAGPSIAGPATWPRDSADPPAFTVTANAAYYVVEIATDAALFGNASARTADTFYATWQDDVGRLTTPAFTLRDDAWTRLRAADRLFYRVGSTSSSTGWDDYQVSTGDDDAANAPSISIT